MRTTISFLSALIILGLVAGCGDTTKDVKDTTIPRVAGLSTTDLVVGQTVYVAGENFLNDSEFGYTELVFEGMFIRDDNVVEDAQFTTRPLFDGTFEEDGFLGDVPVDEGTAILRWSRFGPYKVPFSAEGNRIGTFKGTVTARNVLTDGTVLEQEDPTEVTIQVKPSIIIRRFEPFVGYQEDGTPIYANCGAPALRALNNLPYILEVEVVGYEADFIKYQFEGINGQSGVIEVNRKLDGATTDMIGDPDSGKLIVFNDVPADDSFYYAGIRITATRNDGDGFVETALPVGVHRPMEFLLTKGAARPAQYYEPVPVSGCMPGSLDNSVTYQETKSETRQNSVSVSLSKSWTSSQSVSQSENWSEGISESTTISNSSSEDWSHSEAETASESYGVSMNHSDSQSASFESSDGETYAWSFNQGTENTDMQTKTGELYGEVSTAVNVEVSAEGSVPGFAKVGGKVGSTVGASVGGKTGSAVGQTSGVSTNEGSSMGSLTSTSEGYGSTTTDSTGESLDQSYALTSQDQIGGSNQQSEATSNSKVYTLGGSGGMTEAVSKGEQETWAETWVNSESYTTSMGYSGKIPVNRYGVWYRQTVRYTRQAQVYSYNLCGVRELMGNLTFNEWQWSVDLAWGPDCGGTVLPETDLPQAECVIPPCN